ncbi:oxidoreductase [Thalassobaculum fulvum]|uniref:Oxidoreductase n=1 Tax=Thalassobaculum fulvum TaxID=1633335 RepID=A0A918XY39_9PROT|nr:NAD(P)/FAD-dependent oxidoreductase [Thalassobaculum fulvum]GHD61797.1 oxidoreductase [Thalassobaculum fulvum]
MATVGIVGAGAMGLAAAYHALKAGHRVTVYEADSVPGGMAAHADLDGLSIERFYHFVCKADASTFALMDELGIGDRMRWRDTSMGYFVDGRMYRWGDPVALLTFPKLSPVAKFRYGLQMFLSTKRSDWRPLENRTARDWIENGAGREAYDVLWRRLFELKFFEHADTVSAAWIWTRIKRVGTSRKSLMQEQLGYIDGGSETLVTALAEAIERRGGEIRLGTPVREVVVADGRVTGIRTDAGVDPVDAAISTMPTPYVSRLVPALPDDWKGRYDAIENIGVVCVLLRLNKSVSPHFWVNINDPAVEIPGIIEFSRLRPVDDTVVYVPFYMPQSHPKFGRDDAAFVAESMAAIRRLNPAIGDDDLKASLVGRLRHAQPVCEAGFAAKIPPIQTPIDGLQVADTSFYYPEDRGISESVRYGAMMAAAVGA